VPNLFPGRIVYSVDPVFDPQGENPKADRPLVVVSTNKELSSGCDLKVVAVTTELTLSPEDDYIHLPSGPRSKSRLAAGSAALRTWRGTISQLKVIVTDRSVWPKQVWEILQKIDEIDENDELWQPLSVDLPP
jgi:hypothetical protein